MKNKPQPDRTAEAALVREELSDQADALRSLDALAREDQSEVEIPPIPDELREQWKDRYGVARQPVAREKKSWFPGLGRLWVLAGTAAVAAIAVMISLKEEPTAASPNHPVVLRGAGEFSPKKDTIAVFIPSDSITFEAFSATRQDGYSREASDVDSAVALLRSEQIDSAVIIDAASGQFHPWSGELHEPTTPGSLSGSPDEYDLSEALDDFLKE